MDFQNRVGHKTGSGGPMTEEELAAQRQDRLKKLALETIDLSKDPYLLRNHLGTFECKLCLQILRTEGAYLTHTQGKRHQMNLARRAAKETLFTKKDAELLKVKRKRVEQNLNVENGQPKFTIKKVKHPESGNLGVIITIECEKANKVEHRIMSTYEQKVDPTNPDYQYVVFHCDSYELIGVRVPNLELDQSMYYAKLKEGKYILQLGFKEERTEKKLAALPTQPTVFNPLGVRS